MQHDRLEPPGSYWRAVAVLLFLAGAVARIAIYLQNRSLWYDEAALALNIVERGFIGLLAPLSQLQVAPPLFLWAERLSVLAFGPNEWALRAVPLAAGIATPPVMWRFAHRVAPAPVAIVAVALVALSPALVRYSAEVKPYSLDALVTLVLCDRAVACASPDATRRTWGLLAATGAVAIALSTPAPFVLAGVVALLASRAVIARNSRVIARVVALGASWAVVFVALLSTVFRTVTSATSETGRFMQWFWESNFLTSGPPGLRTKAIVMSWSLLSSTFFGPAAPPGTTTVLVAIAVLGVLTLAVRRNTLVALLVVPIMAACAASALRRYPIAERLMLYAAPLTALVLAFALLAFRRSGDRSLVWLGGAVTAIIAIAAPIGIVLQSRSPEGRQESRALVRDADRLRAQGVPVWVSGGGGPAWLYYAEYRRGDSTRTAKRSFATGSGDVIVGEWYKSVPERIVSAAEDTATLARPSSWSELEAVRLRALARPCALAFLSHIQAGEAEALLASARRLGGRVKDSRRAVGAELYTVCFKIP